MTRKLPSFVRIVRKGFRYAGATVGLVLFKLCLQVLGYKHLSAILTKTSPKPNTLAVAPEYALFYAYLTSRYVLRASRFLIFKSTCLERSLLIWWFLRWQNIAADVRIGVRKDDGAFQAHAWVEYNGVVVNDRADIASLYYVHPDVVSPLMMAKMV